MLNSVKSLSPKSWLKFTSKIEHDQDCKENHNADDVFHKGFAPAEGRPQLQKQLHKSLPAPYPPLPFWSQNNSDKTGVSIIQASDLPCLLWECQRLSGSWNFK